MFQEERRNMKIQHLILIKMIKIILILSLVEIKILEVSHTWILEVIRPH
jgi:hypothetical protein